MSRCHPLKVFPALPFKVPPSQSGPLKVLPPQNVLLLWKRFISHIIVATHFWKKKCLESQNPLYKSFTSKWNYSPRYCGWHFQRLWKKSNVEVKKFMHLLRKSQKKDVFPSNSRCFPPRISSKVCLQKRFHPRISKCFPQGFSLIVSPSYSVTLQAPFQRSLNMSLPKRHQFCILQWK